MHRFGFRQHPATISVSDGISLGLAFWRATAWYWILPAIIAALSGGLFAWWMSDFFTTTFGMSYPANPFAPIAPVTPLDRDALGERMLAAVPSFLGMWVLMAGVGVVVTWINTAIAVAGLRGTPLTAGSVLWPGLRTVGAMILLGIAFLGVFAVVAVVFVAAPPLGLLAFLAMLIPFVYVGLRLAFVSFAIFDGAGPVDGILASWQISRDAVLRIFGWLLLIGVLGFAVSIASSIVSILFFFAPIAGAVVTGAISAAFAVYEIDVLAVLYESQRWIRLPPVAATPVPTVTDAFGPVTPPPPPAPPAWA